MLNNLFKNNTQSSHYFLYLCIFLSSKFLQNYGWLNYFSKKIKKKNKTIRYSFIAIQYLISSFFYYKSLHILMDKKKCRKSKKKTIKNFLFENICKYRVIFYKNIQIQTFFFNFFFFWKLKFKNAKKLNKSQLYSPLHFLGKISKKLFSLENFQITSNRFGLLNYIHLLKISNHYRFDFKLRKLQHILRFGSNRYYKKQDFFDKKISNKQTLKLINLISIQRLNKLRDIYHKNKKQNQELNLKTIIQLIFFFFKNLFIKNFWNFDYKNNNFFNKRIDSLKNNKVKNLKLILSKIKQTTSLKNIEKIIKICQKFFIFIKRFFFTKINFFYKNSIKFYKFNSFENKFFIFFSKKKSTSIDHKKKIFFVIKKNFLFFFFILILIFFFIQRYHFKNIILDNFTNLKCIGLFNNLISINLKKIEKKNIFLTNKFNFFVTKLITKQKISLYNNFIIKNIRFLKEDRSKINKLNIKIIFLERILKIILKKLKCPNNEFKNEIITKLYKKLNCPVIKTSPKEVLLNGCGHLFSSKCIKNLITTRNRKCPVCGKTFSNLDIKQIFLV
jgi:hypothetical protein